VKRKPYYIVFRFTATLDKLPRTAVEEQWSCTGVLHFIVSWLSPGEFRMKISHEYNEREADRYSNMVTPE
jgi:hypothetical protein